MQFLKIRQVMDRTGLSHSSVYLGIKNGTFPAPIKLGPRASAWDEGEITEWQEARRAERDAKLVA